MKNQLDLSNRHIIVTAGPTREWVDPFRFISNPSSGRMGIAIADAAYKLGAQVTLVHGHVESQLLDGKPYTLLFAGTTSRMKDVVLELLGADSVLIMAAAPADYTPVLMSDHKIKKQQGNLVIEFERTPDILLSVRDKKEKDGYTELITIGFAAETNNIIEYAKDKLTRKGLDFICLNDISNAKAGFASTSNEIHIFSKKGEEKVIPLQLKESVATEILNYTLS